METATTETPAQIARACMDKHGLTVAAEFVPWSQSRNKDEKETDSSGKPTARPRLSLNWRVTLAKAGRPILTADYGAGIGHCPAYKNPPKHMAGNVDAYRRDIAVQWECENGKAARIMHGVDFISGKSPILPDPLDVLHSLIMDASALDAGGFEEWARDYGYDTDSRKAEAIYRACLEIALKLRAGLGDAVLSELREAFQDY